MFIQTETTPNPATLKFLPGRDVLAAGTANFASAEEAKSSPLALRLFETDGVTGIFLGADFITVAKTDGADWNAIKPMVLSAIMDHFASGQAVMEGDTAADANADLSAVEKQIVELLETRVRPAVAQDGGDIIFESFEDGIVYLRMQGSCAGCPSSTATLKNGVENMLKYYVPEVTEVRQI